MHLCFGTFGGWPRFAPATLAPTVAFANAAIHAAGRRLDWINIPTLDVTEDSFFAPLADLNYRETRVFLGAIHNNATLEARLKVAQKYLPNFGLSAYCGFGRLEPDAMPGIIKDHELAVTIGKKIGIFD